MASHYSVVQYVPDPIAGERINIGVVAFGDGMVLSRFAEGWELRAKRFGKEGDISYLREFVEQVQSADKTMFLDFWGEQRVSEADIRRMSDEWRGSIQLTKPRASTETPLALLKGVAEKFIRAKYSLAPFRTRLQGTHAATWALRGAIDAMVGGKDDLERLVHRNVPIEGRLDHHEADVGIKNGTLLHGTWVLSFDIGDSIKVEHDVKRTLWTVDDIRKVNKKLPISVLMLLPKHHPNDDVMHDAKRMFDSLGAEVVEEGSLMNWAKSTVEHVLPQGLRAYKE